MNNKFWVRNWTQTAGTPMNSVISWMGGGDPQTPTGGFDISGMGGSDIYIVFGGSGRGGRDSATLNAGVGWPISYGSTPFYGIDGTGVIPTGYVAWDTTGSTSWDASQASKALVSESVGISPSWAVKLSITLSNSNLTASIFTNQFATPIARVDGQLYTLTWDSSETYPSGCFILDGWSPYETNALYYTNAGVSPGGNRPVLNNNNWESAIICAITNTYKLR